MKRLIHVLFAILPLAAHADTWLSGGEAVIPPAVVVSPDNLGNHTATGTLDLAGNTISNVNRIQAADAGGDLAGDWTLNGSAIGGAAAGDNLGDHVATNDLDLADHNIVHVHKINLPDNAGGWELLSLNGAHGSPFDVPVFSIPAFDNVAFYPWEASDGYVLTYDAGQDAWYGKPAAGGGGDNLGDHVATNTLDMGTNRINLSVEGGMVPWQLGAVLDEGGIYPMPQFRGTRSGSPYAAGLMLAGANDGDVLAWDAVHGWYRPLAASGGTSDNLGNHTATQDVDMASHVLTNTAGVIMLAGGYPVGFSGSGDDNSKVGVGIWTPGLSDFVSLIPNYRADGTAAQSGDVLRVTSESFGTKIYHAAPPSGSGSSGNALIGTPGASPANGEDVYVRAGEVTTAGFDFTGQPGTAWIQGATNGAGNKQGAIVMQTHGGDSFNALSGGDITIQSGNGGSMGGSNGVIRIIPGFGAPTDKTPRLLMGNKDAGHYVEFDGEQLILQSGSCTIRFVAPTSPGSGWLEISQGSITKLAFTNDTILIDGSPVYTGTPGPGQTPVFTKGFCTGVTP